MVTLKELVDNLDTGEEQITNNEIEGKLRLSLHSMDTTKRREVNASKFHLPKVIHTIESYNRREER